MGLQAKTRIESNPQAIGTMVHSPFLVGPIRQLSRTECAIIWACERRAFHNAIQAAPLEFLLPSRSLVRVDATFKRRPEPLPPLKSHGIINSHNPTSTKTTQLGPFRNTRQRPRQCKQVLRAALRLEILQMGRTGILAHSPQRRPCKRKHRRTLQTQRPKRTIPQLFLRQFHRRIRHKSHEPRCQGGHCKAGNPDSGILCSSQGPRRKHLRLVPVHRRNVAHKLYSNPTPSFSLDSIRRPPDLPHFFRNSARASTKLGFGHAPKHFSLPNEQYPRSVQRRNRPR